MIDEPLQDARAQVQAWHNETTYAYILGGAIKPGDVLKLLERPHSCVNLQDLSSEHGSRVEGDLASPFFWFRLQSAPDGSAAHYSPCFVRDGNYSRRDALPLPNVVVSVVHAPPPPMPPPPFPARPQPSPPRSPPRAPRSMEAPRLPKVAPLVPEESAQLSSPLCSPASEGGVFCQSESLVMLVIAAVFAGLFIVAFAFLHCQRFKGKLRPALRSAFDIGLAWVDVCFDALFARKAYELQSSSAWPSASLILALHSLLSFGFVLWVIIAITCPLRATWDLSAQIDRDSVHRNGPFVAIILCMAITNVQLVRVLPWTSDDALWDGFPTRSLLAAVSVIALAEDVPQLVVLGLFLLESNQLSSNLVAWINLTTTIVSILWRTISRALRCGTRQEQRGDAQVSLDTVQVSMHDASRSEAESEAATLREHAALQAAQIREAAEKEAQRILKQASDERAQLLESRYTAAHQTLSLELRAMHEDSEERRLEEEEDLRKRIEAEVDAIMSSAADEAARIVSHAEEKAEDMMRRTHEQAAALEEASRRQREAEERLGQFNSTRERLEQEMHEDDARKAEEQQKELELATAHFNATRQLLRDELVVLNEELEERRDADKRALQDAQERTEREAARKLQDAEREAAEKLRLAEELVAVKLQSAEEEAARRLAEMSERGEQSAEVASSELEDARRAAALAAEELAHAHAAAEASRAATEAQIAQELAAQEARLRAQHERDLQRRTGALAEQHARAMEDRDEAHKEQMREQLRQLRLAEASRDVVPAALARAREAKSLKRAV